MAGKTLWPICRSRCVPLKAVRRRSSGIRPSRRMQVVTCIWALKDGPDEFYPGGLFTMDGKGDHLPPIKLGSEQKLGDYTLQFSAL